MQRLRHILHPIRHHSLIHISHNVPMLLRNLPKRLQQRRLPHPTLPRNTKNQLRLPVLRLHQRLGKQILLIFPPNQNLRLLCMETVFRRHRSR